MIVNSTLGKIEIIGLAVGSLLLLVQAALWRARSSEGRSRVICLSLIAVMIACAALSRFWVSAALREIRSRIGVIDDLPLTDPLRVEFNDLHGYSVALMGAAMAAGVVVLFLFSEVMAQAIENIAPCPLCGEEIDISNPRMSAKWKDVFSHGDRWAEVATEFHSSRSIERTARLFSMTADEARLILQFLSSEICGCRRVTCVSCFDDERSEL